MDVLQGSSSALAVNASSSFATPIMHFISSAVLLGSVALQTVLGRPWTSTSGTTTGQVLKRSVDDFIDSETPFALEQLLCNIGADGCNAAVVKAGLVIASPSKQDPPCKSSQPKW
jgi:glucoamylase